MPTITAVDQLVTIKRSIALTAVLYDIMCQQSYDEYGCSAETLWNHCATLIGEEHRTNFNDVVNAVNLLIKRGFVVVSFGINTNLNSTRFHPTDRNLRLY